MAQIEKGDGMNEHRHDEDCTLDPMNGYCVECKADHTGGGCPACGGQAFHTAECNSKFAIPTPPRPVVES